MSANGRRYLIRRLKVNAGMNNGRDKEDKKEANQQDRKDEDGNQTNDTSEETVEKKDNKNVYCVICEKELSGAHRYSVCDQFVHAICESCSEDSERFGLKVACNLCIRKNRINIEREGAKIWSGTTSTKNGSSLQLKTSSS